MANYFANNYILKETRTIWNWPPSLCCRYL